MRSLILGLLFSACTLAQVGCGSKAGDTKLPAIEIALPDPARMVDHPSYKHWGRFPVGTTVTQQTTTDSAKTPGMTVTTIVYVLTEKSDDHIVVTTQAKTVYHGGRVENNPTASARTSRLIQLPDGVKKEDWGKPNTKGEQGTEKLTVAGKEYRTVVHKSVGSTDAGQIATSTWTSDEMPGSLVKAVSVVAAVEETTTIVVVEVKIPQLSP